MATRGLHPMRLKKEIGFTLVFKIAALIVLWWVCFSKPIAPHLNAADIQLHLLGNTPSTQGANHANKS
jgi:hypothetical protein